MKEENTKLDTQRSKYLLNMDSEPELGDDAYMNGESIQNLNQKVSFAMKEGTYFLHVLVFDIYGISKELVSNPIITRGMEILFDFTGKVQSVVLEPGTYKLEVWGAEGGKHGNRTNTPGKGGYSSGILKLESKTKLFIHVGESPTSKNGGWNGGGSGYESCAAGGGGATDISLYGSDGSSDWNNRDHLYSRIIVAGGGGGSAHNSYSGYFGGFGGGLSGQNAGTCNGLGGKQTCAGEIHKFTEYQGFGIGGNHKESCSSGGGGGWYGGSSSNADNGHHAGGSGGSGYVYTQSTAANYPSGCLLNSSFYLSNASTVAGNSSFPSPSNSGNEVGHCGNGYAKISIK